jgi:hypothetical protein
MSHFYHSLALCCLFSLLLATGVARAFPPAPYCICGEVRDQACQTVTAEGAEVIRLKGGVGVGRTPITSSQNRSGTAFYNDKAIAGSGLFSLMVSMNGALFYPVEVSGNLTVGKGGKRVKLDLTLGEDLDKDGLPDTWEAWHLYQTAARISRVHRPY